MVVLFVVFDVFVVVVCGDVRTEGEDKEEEESKLEGIVCDAVREREHKEVVGAIVCAIRPVLVLPLLGAVAGGEEDESIPICCSLLSSCSIFAV